MEALRTPLDYLPFLLPNTDFAGGNPTPCPLEQREERVSADAGHSKTLGLGKYFVTCPEEISFGLAVPNCKEFTEPRGHQSAGRS